MNIRTSIMLIISALVILFSVTQISFAKELEVETELDFWITLHEGNENGLKQASTQDPAVDEVSGFNVKRGRVNFIYDDPERHFGGKLQIRLEQKVDILDCYFRWYPDENYEILLGQMRVPSSYEAMLSERDLDFISRGTLSSLMTDWSLSRTSYFSAFYGNKSNYRDAGIGIKGAFKNDKNVEMLKYFFMIGNGLGNSLYIGGRESKEFIFTNEFGDYFYGLRLDCTPTDSISFGGHYSLNKHDNVLFNDETTVFDLKRSSRSIDFRYTHPDVRFALMYGGGVIDDDYFHTGTKNLDYSGWETKIVVPLTKSIEGGVRYDNYQYKAHGSTVSTNQNNITLGLNYNLEPGMKVQVNYILKDTDNNIDADPDDNIFFVNFQYIFNSGNLIETNIEDNDTETETQLTEEAQPE